MSKIFVCATSGEGRCGAKGGGALLDAFKDEVERQGLSSSTVLQNACIRRHDEGPIVFIFPEDIVYTHVRAEDVPGIVERHLAVGSAGRSRSGRL